MSKRLEGKVAFITGATSGIGAVMARLFAAEGARLMLASRRQSLGESLVAGIKSSGGEAAFQPMDVAIEGDVEQAIKRTVDEYGAIDIVVNNAGPMDLLMSGSDAQVHETREDGFDAILRVGLYGPMWCCKHALPHMMRAGRGSIVNISSVSSVLGLPRLAAYSAAKGGLNALTRQMAVDYGASGVRANAIIVGFIEHETTAGMVDTPEKHAAFRNRILTRLGRPEDVAHAAIYLASDESIFLTGSQLAVDGGVMVKSR